ncbi:MAG: S1 family peptidase, partial [Terriglobia bacterium]
MRIIRQLASPARVAVVVLAALACFSSVARSAAESEEQIRRWSQSVVQVQARQCAAGPAQAGTGFLWQKPEWVVTSLHVVNGCQQISVYSESAGVTRPAHLDHVLRAADLAVLRMDNPPRLPLLPAAPARPSVNEDLLTLGYELNIPKLSSTSLRVRYGGKHLEDIVPPAVRSDLARAGSPDVGIDIVFLEGHLLH